MRSIWSISHLLLYIFCIIWICIGEVDEKLIEKDLYGVLGLTKEATLTEIKKSYRKLAQIYHPDKVGSADKEEHEEIFREIAEAYEVLSSKITKEEYDYKRMVWEQRMHRRARSRQDGSSSGTHAAQSFANGAFEAEIHASGKDFYRDNYFGSNPEEAFDAMLADLNDIFGGYGGPSYAEPQRSDSNAPYGSFESGADYFEPSLTGPILNTGQVKYGVLFLIQSYPSNDTRVLHHFYLFNLFDCFCYI